VRYPETESNTIEFKRELPRNNQVVKTIIGFCNTFGGKLIIGVADDGEIVGISEEEIEVLTVSLEQSIFDACNPTIIPHIYTQRFNDLPVMIIEVAEGMNKPYYLRSEGSENGTYIRLDRHTMQAREDMIKELSWKTHGIDYERLPVYRSTIEDIDSNLINKFLSARKNKGIAQLDEQTLRSYDIITYDQSRKYPSVLGILLFGRNPQQYISEAMIICSHFKGVEGRDAIATVDCEGTLFNQFNQAYSFIISRIYRSFTIQGLKRQEKLEIPEEAIREALLNLIVHRNYHLKAPAKIAIYDDRVEFYSPGQFPGQFNPKHLLSGVSSLRNPGICKILREADYIEKLGSGFITIFSSYQKRGLKVPQVIDGGVFVKCILPREMHDMDGIIITDDFTKIKELFRTRQEYTANEIAQHLGVSHTTIIRWLNKMITQGILTRTGQRRNIKYRLMKN
jgi:Predicted transcriptional regulator containing an HTH domain and an uncharacterized domain shared with the mammalian protein Schlafen